MKKNLILLLIILLGGAIYTTYENFYAVPQIEIASKYSKTPNLLSAPDFSWQDLNGQKFRLSEINDKVVVLNFWATWCAPCVMEFPKMINLAKSNHDKVVFLFLSVDHDKEAIKKFLKKYAPALPMNNVYIGWDKNKDVSLSLYGTKKFPETYILTPSHKIYEKIIGADVNWNGSDIQNKIDRASKIKD